MTHYYVIHTHIPMTTRLSLIIEILFNILHYSSLLNILYPLYLFIFIGPSVNNKLKC